MLQLFFALELQLLQLMDLFPSMAISVTVNANHSATMLLLFEILIPNFLSF